MGQFAELERRRQGPQRSPGPTQDTEASSAAVADALAGVLADTGVLYFQTHAYHWNVTGPAFPQLHALFQAQYEDLWKALDGLAERMRALGSNAPSTLAWLVRRSSLQEDDSAPDASAMLDRLAAGHVGAIRGIEAAVALADSGRDVATTDLLTARLAAHQQALWMLRSTIG